MKPTQGAAQVAQNASHMHRLLERLSEIEQRLRAGGGLKKVEKQHRDGKLTARERMAALLDSGRPVSRNRPAGRLRPVRRPGAGGGRGHRRGQDRGPAGGGGGQRRHRESRRVVARDHHQDPARAGNRHAQPRADRLPGGFGGRQPAAPGRHFPRPVRRRPHLLLQLADAAQAARAADRRRHGAVHRRRRLSARAFATSSSWSKGPASWAWAGRTWSKARPAKWSTPNRSAAPHAHGRERRGALQGRRRSRLPGDDPAEVPRTARQRPRRHAESSPRSPPKACTRSCRPITACPTTCRKSSHASSTRGDYLEFQPEHAPEMLCAEARLAGRPVA